MFDILLNVTYLAAIAMSLYSAVWLLLKADRNRTVCAFIACQLLIVVWCVPQLFLGFVQSREGLYTAYAVSYVGICFIGPAWLVFALWYGGKTHAPLGDGADLGLARGQLRRVADQ